MVSSYFGAKVIGPDNNLPSTSLSVRRAYQDAHQIIKNAITSVGINTDDFAQDCSIVIAPSDLIKTYKNHYRVGTNFLVTNSWQSAHIKLNTFEFNPVARLIQWAIKKSQPKADQQYLEAMRKNYLNFSKTPFMERYGYNLQVSCTEPRPGFSKPLFLSLDQFTKRGPQAQKDLVDQIREEVEEAKEWPVYRDYPVQNNTFLNF